MDSNLKVPSPVDWLFDKIIETNGLISAKDVKQAKEFEKKMAKQIWNASYENMRKTFGTSNHTPIDFEEHWATIFNLEENGKD